MVTVEKTKISDAGAYSFKIKAKGVDTFAEDNVDLRINLVNCTINNFVADPGYITISQLGPEAYIRVS